MGRETLPGFWAQGSQWESGHFSEGDSIMTEMQAWQLQGWTHSHSALTSLLTLPNVNPALKEHRLPGGGASLLRRPFSTKTEHRGQ